MTSRLLEATAIVVEKSSHDQAVITQQPGHRFLAELIAGRWADDRNQQIEIRPFVCTAIRTRHGGIRRMAIEIDGTPSRGFAVVKITGRERALRTADESRRLSIPETRLLQQFAQQVIAAVWPKNGGDE